MKREKQKCISVCLIVFVLDIFTTVQGHTFVNLLNSSSFKNYERSASLFTPFSENRLKSQHLQQYFKKVMEPIRNLTFSNDRKDFSSNIHSTSPYYQSRMNEMNTLPNYLYPSLHSTPYTPPVITKQNDQQNHLTQKKGSVDITQFKESTNSSKSMDFRPRVIPIKRMDSTFSSRTLRVLENENKDEFQPIIPNQSYIKMVKDQKYSRSDDDVTYLATAADIKTTTIPSGQSSTPIPWKNVPETKRPEKPLTSRSLLREEEARGKIKKKYKKFMLPLLLAYKLKFFTLIPLMIGGLVLLTGATGMAGFFFALFASVIGLRVGNTSSHN